MHRSPDAGEPLSATIPIPPNMLTPYRIVIIMRLIILGLFFHYRVTNPVDSAFGLWLTSIICEIWFAVSWVLDQFPKWYPVNRETYIDRLSLRYAFETSETHETYTHRVVSIVHTVEQSWMCCLTFHQDPLGQNHPFNWWRAQMLL